MKIITPTFAITIASMLLLTGCADAFKAGQERVEANRLLAAGNYKEAIAKFKDAASLHASGPEYTGLGIAYEKDGQYAEAAQSFEKAIKLFSSPAENSDFIKKLRKADGAATPATAYAHAANVFLKQHNLVLANSYVKKAIELEPENTAHIGVLAAVEEANCNYKQSVVDASKLIDGDPGSVDGYLVRARSEIGLKEFASAVADADAAKGIDPTNKEAESIKTMAQAAEKTQPKPGAKKTAHKKTN